MKTAEESKEAAYAKLLADMEAAIERAISKYQLEACVYVELWHSSAMADRVTKELEAKNYSVEFVRGFPGIYYRTETHYLIRWNK